MYMMTKLHKNSFSSLDLNDLEIVYASQGVLVNGIANRNDAPKLLTL